VILALTAAVIFALMAIEARRAALNERTQRAAGGIVPPGDVYPLMQVAYPGAFVAMIVEGALRGGAPATVAALGVIVLAAAKALKWWAILTLGRAWTFRVIVVPGARRITSGPYRFFNHPNYIAVVGELLGAALVCGAVLSGPAATAFFLVLMLKRIAVENRAVATHLHS
jgi:methyltransferase